MLYSSPDPRALVLLKRVVATMKATKSLRAEWQRKHRSLPQEVRRGVDTIETGKLLALKPNFLRLDCETTLVLRGREGAKQEPIHTTWAHDGKNNWLVLSKTYSKKQSREPIAFAPWADLFSDQFSYLAIVERAQRDGTFQSLSYVGQEVFEEALCEVVRYRHKGVLTQGDIHLFIGPDGLVHRELSEISTQGSAWQSETILRHIERNPRLSPQEFVYTPPADHTEQPPPGSPEPPATFLKFGTPAPDFMTLTPEGKEVRLSDFRGRVVVLDFWATWCAPCLLGMPGLSAVAQKYKHKNVVVLAVAIWDDKEKFLSWLQGPGKAFSDITFVREPTLSQDAERNATAQLYQLNGLPTQYIIDKKGVVRIATRGVPETTKPLEDELKKLAR